MNLGIGEVKTMRRQREEEHELVEKENKDITQWFSNS